MNPLTRRTFLQGALSATAATVAGANQPVPAPLTPFPYGAVQLLDGPLKRQFDENHAFFLNLSEDRMLKIFRQRTGLPAPGEDMGGWYNGFCPGAHFGQYVSALARFAAATDSQPTRAKVSRLIKGYSQTLDAPQNFFVDLRYPAYTYDKMVLALIDAHSYANDATAFEVLKATTRSAVPHMPERALTKQEQNERPHKDETYTWDETYTLAENLFLAYDRTGDRQYFDMGKRYLLDRTFFDPLSQGENVLPGLHAYSHMNALSSGMQGYFKLGDKKYLNAVTNAVDFIWKDQSFATGGWGPNESFVEPGKGMLGASLTTTHRSFETPCGAYAHIKLMRYLFTLTRDPRYLDSMEQVLWNTVLGVPEIRENGSSFYYSDYAVSGFKTQNRDVPGAKYEWDRDGRWPCCSGTLPQAAADYVVDTYFRAGSSIFVNLYVPSRLSWTANSVRCSLTQQTAYPTENLVTMKMAVSAPLAFALQLRIPGWAGPNSSVSINGRRLTQTVSAGTFFEVHRTWKAGDTVELEIDQRMRLKPVDAQTPNQVAVMRGPQVLFAIAKEQPTLPRGAQLTKGADHDWDLGELLLRPFPYIGQETYQTYILQA